MMSLYSLRRVELTSLLVGFAIWTGAADAQTPTASLGIPTRSSIASQPAKGQELDPTYTLWFDRRLAVAEAQIEAEKDGESRLQTLITVVSLVFGALMTTLVIFFALRTERTAAAAATKAAQDAVADGKAEVESCVKAAVSARNEADRILAEIRSGYGEAETHIAKIKAAAKVAESYQPNSESSLELSAQEGDTLQRGAEALAKQPPSAWSLEDYRVLLSAAQENADYTRVAELAVILRNMDKSAAAQAISLNFEGIAFAEQKRYDEALSKFKDVSEMADGDNLEVRRVKALAQRNVALVHKEMGNTDKALKLLDATIEEQRSSDDPRIKLNVARAYVSKIGILKSLDLVEDARDALQQMNTLWDNGTTEVRSAIANCTLSFTYKLQEEKKYAEASAMIEALLKQLSEDREVASKVIERTVRRLQQLRSAETKQNDPIADL
jgi:tetratricopeptide (TPR) repeat protein